MHDIHGMNLTDGSLAESGSNAIDSRGGLLRSMVSHQVKAAALAAEETVEMASAEAKTAAAEAAEAA